MLGAKTIYVKGLEKKQWLEKYVLNVRDLEEFDCPSIQKLKCETSKVCKNHVFQDANCAVTNVSILRNWFLNPVNKFVTTLDEGKDEVDCIYSTLTSLYENCCVNILIRFTKTVKLFCKYFNKI